MNEDAALQSFDELDRLFADADRHDEIIRLGWIEQRDARLIQKYGSLENALFDIERDEYEPEDGDELF